MARARSGPTAVSVCLATYDGEPYLSELLESLRAQQSAPDELVVSDDGSSDASVALVEAFAARAPFEVRLLRGTHAGIAANFERAVAVARGDVVCFCDQDDVWRPAKVAVLRDVFSEPGDLAGAVHDSALARADGSLIGRTLWQRNGFSRRARSALERGDGLAALIARPQAVGHALALSSSALELARPFGARAPYDLWCARMAASLGALATLDEPLVEHRVHPRAAVGVPSTGTLGARLARRDATRRAWLDEAAGLLELERRLEEKRPQVLSENVRAVLRAKVTHLERRAGFGPPQRIRSLGGVTNELALGRYHRYSHGLSSAASDAIATLL